MLIYNSYIFGLLTFRCMLIVPHMAFDHNYLGYVFL